MTSAAQAALFPTPPASQRRRPARTLTVAPTPAPALTPRLATEQARQALITAGLLGQVSRVFPDATLRVGWIAVIVLLRDHADPVKVAEALTAPGVEVWRGKSAVVAYRKGAS